MANQIYILVYDLRDPETREITTYTCLYFDPYDTDTLQEIEEFIQDDADKTLQNLEEFSITGPFKNITADELEEEEEEEDEEEVVTYRRSLDRHPGL